MTRKLLVLLPAVAMLVAGVQADAWAGLFHRHRGGCCEPSCGCPAEPSCGCADACAGGAVPCGCEGAACGKPKSP
jgi:hypothetical protein